MLRWQFQSVHGLMNAADQVTAGYALAVVCEDVIVNGVLAHRNPLALSTWRNRTGLTELPPLCRQADRRAWAQQVTIDSSALHDYARAVQFTTDAYLSGLDTDDDALARGGTTARVLNALLLRLGWAPRTS